VLENVTNENGVVINPQVTFMVGKELKRLGFKVGDTVNFQGNPQGYFPHEFTNQPIVSGKRQSTRKDKNEN
jgi:hypothetical protein